MKFRIRLDVDIWDTIVINDILVVEFVKQTADIIAAARNPDKTFRFWKKVQTDNGSRILKVNITYGDVEYMLTCVEILPKIITHINENLFSGSRAELSAQKAVGTFPKFCDNRYFRIDLYLQLESQIWKRVRSLVNF